MPTVQPDDEVYRVNNIWLGPPEMTLFRARYAAWGIGIAVFLATFALAKAWFGLGVFVIGWSLVITVVITRWIGSKIAHERGPAAVATMFIRELTTPRRRTTYTGGAADASAIRTTNTRPTPPTDTPADPPTEPIPVVPIATTNQGWHQPTATHRGWHQPATADQEEHHRG